MTVKSTTIKHLLLASATFGALPAYAQDQFRVCADPLNPPYSTQAQSGYENKIAALFASQLGQALYYFWLPERIGFVRNSLKSENDDGTGYKCDVIMGVPAGYDLTATTQPYFHSTYVLLIAKGRGWDDIATAEQLAQLPFERRKNIKIAMFDRGPGTEWLQKHDLLEQGVPYQSMTGDAEHNIAMQIENDLSRGVIDMAILWGPMAAYVQSKQPKNELIAIPMQSSEGVRFDFSIAMGVRQGDDERKKQLNALIDKNRDEIARIITGYNIPLLPIPPRHPPKDDD
ncbi:MAG: quinoprotein dehydrogenase-associated putative ABC transporter substrate-binding protein [Methylomonas sp.]|nr:quinoprotein dehydrogenase-associated putative ABC transporter substrate-binding protein [Methylomonas sp.]PPD22563.1 MAG: ABC transporter substrate-binding protein [Methylomonas sp.]PPD27873.1 MAG: ABC transporter substrate-binding protein [Methylomonas sp.]PPD39983.1 MAG: ABC transporter substrate-binding protein [Methylomonas sp.]PPD41036.1 MAG: ABC transporter substrate-binding protein [Methylomonas sp.]